MVNELAIVKRNIDSVPVAMYDTVAAVTLDMSSGISDDMVRSMSSTSMVNTNPAIGALKIPATAPAVRREPAKRLVPAAAEAVLKLFPRAFSVSVKPVPPAAERDRSLRNPAASVPDRDGCRSEIPSPSAFPPAWIPVISSGFRAGAVPV